MTKKKQELKADTVLKNYWSNNEQFADLFNAVLFDGNQVIHPEELEEADTEASSLLEHGDYAMSIKASRDTIKIQKKSTVYGVKETKERAIEYTRKNQIDKTVVLTVAGAVNCKINYHALAEKGEADMCTVFEEIAKESERKSNRKNTRGSQGHY